jgi:hypothetical protein
VEYSVQVPPDLPKQHLLAVFWREHDWYSHSHVALGLLLSPGRSNRENRVNLVKFKAHSVSKGVRGANLVHPDVVRAHPKMSD